MSVLRTVISALCIVAGAVLIASWAVSSVIVAAVEDGTALRGMTERAMDSPTVRSEVAAQITDQALAALGDNGVPVEGALVQSAVEATLDGAVASEGFREAVLREVDAAHAQFADALTDSLREPAPLVLEVDVSGAVNARIDDVPGIGGAVPDLSIPPVDIEVLGAETFETTRSAYERVAWAAEWGLWVGLALLVVGIVVSHRRRWFVTKVLLLLGGICLAFGGAIALLGPETIVTFIPGGTDGPYATLWSDVITEEAAPVVMERSLWIAGAAFAAALVATVVGALLGGRRR